MPTFGQKNLPSQQVQFVDAAGVLTKFGIDYLNSLFQQATTLAATVSTGLVATGTTQGTALVLTSDWNDFLTVAVNTGGKLQPLAAGQTQEVFNGGANALSVYPPLGCKIDAGLTNAPYSLAAGKRQIFKFSAATQIRSTQLG